MAMKLTIVLVFVLAMAFSAIAQNERDEAVELYRQQQCEKAIPILTKALEADKEDNIALFYLGACYVKTGKEKLAKEAFLQIKPTKNAEKGDLDSLAHPNKSVFARYTEEARQARISGVVKIAFEIKADGTIGFVFPFKNQPFGLTESAVNALKRTKFTPAMKDGKAVDSVTIRDYTFTIY